MTVGNAIKLTNTVVTEEQWLKATKYGKLSPNGKAIVYLINDTNNQEGGEVRSIIDNVEGSFRFIRYANGQLACITSKKGILTQKSIPELQVEEIIEEKKPSKRNSYLKYGEQIASICKDIENTSGIIASVLNKKNDVFVITYKLEEDWIEMSGIKGSNELVVSILETE